jgi:hypothetical protein
MASEGHFTVPYQDHRASGILTLRTNYYEFIPEEAHGSENPPVLSSHELEIGKRYAMILTTASGLYRYDLNDIVEVAGLYHETPVIAFVRKGQEMTNITGEKMHVNHFIAAFEEMGKIYQLPVKLFRVRPDFEVSRYSIYLEMSADFPDDTLRNEVLPSLDRCLARLNVEYAEKRRSKRLHLPCLYLMRPGWADEECQREAASGKRDTQYKWRILCPEPSSEDIAAAIKKIENQDDD